MQNFKNLIKIFSFYIILFLITISCNSQSKELREAKLSLEQEIDFEKVKAKLELEKEPVYSPYLIIKPFAEENSKKYVDSLYIKNNITTYLESLTFDENIKYPENYFKLNYSSVKIAMMTGDIHYFDKNKNEEPTFFLEKVNFNDNSSQKIQNDISYEEDYNLYHITINSSKPTKQLVVNVKYTYPKIEKLSFRRDQLSVKLPEGTINLLNIDYNSATFSIPKELKDKVLDVVAYDSIGQPVEKYSFDKNSKPIGYSTLSNLKNLIRIQKEAVKKLDNNEFKTIEELNNFILAHILFTEETDEIIMICFFKTGISFVDLIFQKGEKINAEHRVIIENEAKNKNKTNFYIVTDSQTKLKGLLNLNGKWICPPIFKKLYFINDFYYKGIKEDDPERPFKDDNSYSIDDGFYYLLNKQTKTLNKVDYFIDDVRLFTGNYVIVYNLEKESGIINVEKNIMVLPFKYSLIREENGLFVVKNKEGKWGVIDYNMKAVLPEIYYDIDVKEDEIITVFKIPGISEEKGFFTKQGKKK